MINILDGFVVVNQNSKDISDKVKEVLATNRKQMPLERFATEVTKRVGFPAFDVVDARNKVKIETYRKSGFTFYRLENEIVHEI